MKSDYMKLCDKYEKLLLNYKMLEIENKKIDRYMSENEKLKQEIFELKLLLDKKIWEKLEEENEKIR